MTKILPGGYHDYDSFHSTCREQGGRLFLAVLAGVADVEREMILTRTAEGLVERDR